jgi:hypothetical protein
MRGYKMPASFLCCTFTVEITIYDSELLYFGGNKLLVQLLLHFAHEHLVPASFFHSNPDLVFKVEPVLQ